MSGLTQFGAILFLLIMLVTVSVFAPLIGFTVNNPFTGQAIQTVRPGEIDILGSISFFFAMTVFAVEGVEWLSPVWIVLQGLAVWTFLSYIRGTG